MALDAYLVVFHHFDAPSLQRLEPKYVAVITVLTFIPAFTFLFIRTAAKGPIYGNSIVGVIRKLNRSRKRLITKNRYCRFGVQ